MRAICPPSRRQDANRVVVYEAPNEHKDRQGRLNINIGIAIRKSTTGMAVLHLLVRCTSCGMWLTNTICLDKETTESHQAP